MAGKTREGSTGSANARLDEVANLKAAKAAAQQQNTDEAQALQLRREQHVLTHGVEVPFNPDSPDGLFHDEVSPPLDGGVDTNGDFDDDYEMPPSFEEQQADEGNHTPQTLSERLASAIQPVIDRTVNDNDGPQVHGVGRANIQWVVAEGQEDNPGGLQFVLSVQVDEQPPGHVSFDLTPEMLDKWYEGEGLQKNRIGHKQFAAGIIEKAVEMSCYETGNNLIYTLEQLMVARNEYRDA